MGLTWYGLQQSCNGQVSLGHSIDRLIGSVDGTRCGVTGDGKCRDGVKGVDERGMRGVTEELDDGLLTNVRSRVNDRVGRVVVQLESLGCGVKRRGVLNNSLLSRVSEGGEGGNDGRDVIGSLCDDGEDLLLRRGRLVGGDRVERGDDEVVDLVEDRQSDLEESIVDGGSSFDSNLIGGQAGSVQQKVRASSLRDDAVHRRWRWRSNCCK